MIRPLGYKRVYLPLFEVAVTPFLIQGDDMFPAPKSTYCVYRSPCMEPSKHKTFVYHLYNVGPTSSTLDQHCTNAIQMFCAYWEVIIIWIGNLHGLCARGLYLVLTTSGGGEIALSFLVVPEETFRTWSVVLDLSVAAGDVDITSLTRLVVTVAYTFTLGQALPHLRSSLAMDCKRHKQCICCRQHGG